MPVVSKMAKPHKHGHGKGPLLLGAAAAACAVAGSTFTVAFQAPLATGAPPPSLQQAKRLRAAPATSGAAATEAAAAAAGAATGPSPPAAAALAAGGSLGLAMAAAREGAKVRRSAKGNKIGVAGKEPASAGMKGGLPELVTLATEILAGGGSVDDALAQRLRDFAAAELRSGQQRHDRATQAFAEALRGAWAALRDGASGEARRRWALGAAASMLLACAADLQPASAADQQVTYSDFLQQVQRGEVEVVRVQKDLLTAQYTSKDGAKKEVNLIPNAMVEDELFSQLAAKKVDVIVQGANANTGGPLDFLSKYAGNIAWLIAGLLLLFGGLGAGGPAGMGGQNPFQLGKSPAKVMKEGDIKVKFGDVAGCDGAKEELVEVVDFLKNTSRYSELGAKIPKGALLVGPPGTGKTLLAKAVAGEAGVPFFSTSASEFVEVFAGIGASRVRDLFAEAKKAAPCIIFIDEIDAVGRQRSAGFGQGNDEREQTVNQLLTEMDGFEGNNGVVVIAATNRADILDQALVRPGRFDRQIQVDPPDVEGRAAILKVHAKDKSLAPSVDLSAIARQTPGMSGADLANLLNEGAIVAARQSKMEIDQDDIANALERIMIGLEKKDAVMSDKKKKLVAYHEAGHAVLGALMNDFDIVTKISIVPRGPAGGVTIFTPSEDRLNTGLYSKEFLENRMCVALGGRIAEEIINGVDNVTTGASNDFQQCTQVATAMVTQLGMSDAVGQRIIGQQQGGGGGPFMGRDFMGQGAPPVSQSLRMLVDSEVKRIVDEQYRRGVDLLKANMYVLDNLAEMLLEQEKVGGEELMKLVNKAAAKGKLVMPDQKLAAAAFVGERVEYDAKKSQCVHPDKPLMFACGDCPRRGGKMEEQPVAVAAYAGEEVFVGEDAKKTQCVHPDKPLMFACGDCPRRGGKMEEQPVAVAAYAGEEVFVGEDAKKTTCLHPDKPMMFACGDCPRRGGKMEEQPVAVAAYAGEEVFVGQDAKKTACLHPDKPLMFACGDCPRRGGKMEEQPVAVAAYAGEEVFIGQDAKKTACLHPDKPMMFACGDCPRRGGKMEEQPVAVAAYAGEEVFIGQDAKKTACLHPDKPMMFACGDCPRRGGKMEEQPMAVAAFAGEEVFIGQDAKKTACLHPDKPMMFACGDCPRRGGKMEEQPVAVAAYAGEEVFVGQDAKKTACLHPDKPMMFACGDCPRRG